ncbi:Feminization-1b [Oopsacas minuta]|uniref:Feminization-1b n=1 Tax=Oopsacas minuta TaxID=111878 RepID=A0AAV7JGX7_9METZ|nr:Feminization-1b [Oopsacas minuta]
MASSHLQPLTTTSSDELSWNKQLMDCAAKGEISLFQDQLATLLKNTVPEEIFQPEGNKGSPLVRAAQNGQNMIVTYILKNFIEVLDLEYTMTVKSNHAVLEIRGVTALWCAALGGHIDIVRELVEAGANINHTNATNSTPLSAASYNNRVEVIKCLLNKGADISIANQGGLAPVMVAVMRDNEDAIRLLEDMQPVAHEPVPDLEAFLSTLALHTDVVIEDTVEPSVGDESDMAEDGDEKALASNADSLKFLSRIENRLIYTTGQSPDCLVEL